MLGAPQGCPGSQSGAGNQQGSLGPGDKARPLGKLGKDEDPALSAVIQNWRESRPGVSKESQGTCPAAVILRDYGSPLRDNRTSVHDWRCGEAS